MERMTGIEPVLPAWQAGVRTTIRHPHYLRYQAGILGNSITEMKALSLDI